MFCKKCGTENRDDAKFCKKCGTDLSHSSDVQYPTKQLSDNNSSSGTKKVIIISLTAIICTAIIGGALLYMNFNNNSNISNSNESVNTQDTNNQTTNNVTNTKSKPTEDNNVAVTDVKANSNNIKILSGEFYTGHKLSDKTYCDVYVGEEFAGTKLKIQIWYSRDGSTLNPGNIVPKTVSNDGYVTLRSANSFKYYPDHASITLYDTAGNILDTKEVEMSASSGTQTF